jgi:hypothetical protein
MRSRQTLVAGSWMRLSDEGESRVPFAPFSL